MKETNVLIKICKKELCKKKKDGDKLIRIVSFVKCLSKNNLAFRQSNGKLYEDSNEFFWQ